MDSTALDDYGIETSRDALEVLFRFEESFGARPEADASGARFVVDPAAPGAQKLDTAVRAWAATYSETSILGKRAICYEKRAYAPYRYEYLDRCF